MFSVSARRLLALTFLLAGCESAEERFGQQASHGGGAPDEGNGGAQDWPCGQDCTAIETPDCYTSVCDLAVKKCKVVASTDGTTCDDGKFCTTDDACIDGECTGGPANTCDEVAEACHRVHCNEETDSCSMVSADDGAECETGDLCMVEGACVSGNCVGKIKDCFFAPMPDECHVGVCNPQNGACDPTPGNDGKSCPTSGDLCTVSKTCDAGVCGGGTPKDCSSLDDDCVVGMCNATSGACFAEPIPEGGVCALSEALAECNTGICNDLGACEPVPTPGVACASKTDACNSGTCNAGGTCDATPVNEGGTCEDGNSCTLGDMCTSGVCVGGTSQDVAVYFSESFGSNAQGWTLGTEWEIGAAEASTGGSYCCDPASDHTPTADNGLAGVVIGGHPAKVVHPQYYIESPVFDTSAATGPVILGFYRWLLSDYTPYMKNVVEVYNGTTWNTVFQTGGTSTIDKSWQFFSYDITAHKSATTKIRFGFEIGNAGVYTIGSWSIDDVVVANQICQGSP